MREIPLTQGQFAIVDDGDYDWLNQYKWNVLKMNGGNFYAVRSSLKNGKQYAIYMTRFILGLEFGDSRQADHQNHNTLDNRRDNIRICTPLQNQRNQKLRSNTSSKYKGVYWDKLKQKWGVQITINRKHKHLGYWIMEEVAALRYDMVAIREYGVFVQLNFN